MEVKSVRDKKPTTFASDSDRLARLLSVGVEPDDLPEASPHEAKAELLSARLAEVLPPEAGASGAGSLLGRLQRKLLPTEGRTLGEVLLDKRTRLEVFEAIKARHKRLAGDKEDACGHAVAVAIYFAAIAGALLFHRKRITSYSHEDLAGSFRVLSEKRWMPPELAEHFVKARQFCLKQLS